MSAAARSACAEPLPRSSNLAVSIKALPLAIANAIRPDLALGGTIDGSAAVTGTRAAPDVAFDLKGRAIAAAALRQAGLRSINVDAKGTSSAQTAQHQCVRRQPRGCAGDGGRHSSAGRRGAGSRRQSQSVSACRAERRRPWPGAWRHDFRSGQDSRLAGAAEGDFHRQRRSSQRDGARRFRPVAAQGGCGRQLCRSGDRIVDPPAPAPRRACRSRRAGVSTLPAAVPTSRSRARRRCRSPTASSPIAARKYRAPSRSPRRSPGA